MPPLRCVGKLKNASARSLCCRVELIERRGHLDQQRRSLTSRLSGQVLRFDQLTIRLTGRRDSQTSIANRLCADLLQPRQPFAVGVERLVVSRRCLLERL